jgi:outer membrane immunogenic protein
MKKLIMLAAGAVAGLAITSSAMAADMPARVYKAPPPIMPVFSWSGFYIGLNGGYSWGRSRTDGAFFNNTTGALIVGGADRSDLKGGVFGGQAGFNMQAGNFVYGIEADGQWSGEKGDTFAACNLAACIGTAFPPGGAVSATATLNQKIDWFATLRGRLGVTVTPTVLLYATGGGAYGEVKSTGVVTGFNGLTAISVARNVTTTHGGWVVGGGIEGALGSNWTAKLEYLYMDLGTTTGSGVLTAAAPPLLATFSSRITDQILRGGFNYKF